MGQQLALDLMAGIIEQLEQQKTRDENAGLAIAAGKAQWANNFSSYTPDDKLRANLNLETLKSNALQRRMELEARSNLKTQQILESQAKMKNNAELQPLRAELLKQKIATEGAHEEFVQRKDAEAMADLTGFLKATSRLGKPGTPAYQDGLNAALQTHPRAIGTQVGADALKRLQQDHVDIAGMTPPPGQRYVKTEFTEDGKAKAVFEPVPEGPTTEIPPGMVPLSANHGKSGVSIQYGTPKAEKDSLIPSLEKERAIHVRMLDRAKRIRSKATDPAIMADSDEDIRQSEKDLSEVESQIRTHREGKAAPQAAADPAAQEAVSSDGKSRIVTVQSKETYDSLASGEEFIDPQGVKRRKP